MIQAQVRLGNKINVAFFIIKFVIIGYMALVDSIVNIWSFIFAYNKHE